MRRCKSQNPCAVHLTRRSSLQGLVLVWAIFPRSDAGRPFLIFIRSQYLAQLDEEVESTTRPSHIGMEEGSSTSQPTNPTPESFKQPASGLALHSSHAEVRVKHLRFSIILGASILTQ